MSIDVIFDKLYEYFGVNLDIELAHKMGISQPAMSKWRTRGAISAVKKKCRELGIYSEIFGDNAQNVSNHSKSSKDRKEFDKTLEFIKLHDNILSQASKKLDRDEEFLKIIPNKIIIHEELFKMILKAIVMVDDNEEKINQLENLIKNWTKAQL